MPRKHTISGFSLVEMLVYTALLVLILSVLVNVVFSFTRSYEQLGALRAAEHTGLTAMERMIRDIHTATSVNMSGSVFGTSPGSLSLINGATTTKFYLDNGALKVDVNGLYSGPLSISSTLFSNLTFTLITTANSQAVKIDMTVNGKKGTVTKTKTYHSTALLKKS